MDAKRRLPVLFALAAALSFTARAAVIKEFTLPANAHPALITVGADGNVWFAESGLDKIGRLTPSGAFADFATVSTGCAPVGVTLAADGRLWYTCTGSAHVGSMAVNPGPQNPAVEYGAGGTPYGPIASGPAGRLWFTDIAGEIADFDIDTQTVINYELPAMDHAFVGVADGGDGRLWATDVAAYVEEVKPTDGGLTSVGQPLPTSTAYPYLIAWCQGWGGAWLAEGAGNALAFVPRSTSPIVEVPLPNASSAPYAVACDAQGSVWYTAPGINKIGRYRKDTLTFEEFTVPTANANVNGIAVAGDGSIWFTELNANKVGRLQIRPQGDANGDGTVDVADVFYVINFLFAGGPPPVP